MKPKPCSTRTPCTAWVCRLALSTLPCLTRPALPLPSCAFWLPVVEGSPWCCLACQLHVSSLCLCHHRAFPSYGDPNQIRPHMWLSALLNLITSAETLFPNKVTFPGPKG